MTQKCSTCFGKGEIEIAFFLITLTLFRRFLENILFSHPVWITDLFRECSSVGLEHYLDRVGVGGSNPSTLTSEAHNEIH